MLSFDTIYSLYTKIPFARVVLGIIFAIFWLQVFFISYHLIRFGIGPKPKFFALLFLAGAVVFFTAGVYNFQQIDWGVFKTLLSRQSFPHINLPQLNY